MGNEWDNVKLGDVCSKIGSGATPRGGSKVYLEHGPFALVRSQNVYNDHFAKAGLAYITAEHADGLSNVELQPLDVLLNITGDSVARCCMVDESILPARVNQHVAIVRPDADKLDPVFLRYYLVSPGMQQQMLSWAAAGGTRSALTKGMIESFEVPCPSIEEQRNIAQILGTLDDKIECNRRLNRTLEDIVRALFKSWFVDFDPVIDNALEAGNPIPEELADRATLRQQAAEEYATPLPEDFRALFPAEFTHTEAAGWIPEGWEAVPVSSVTQVNPRIRLSKGKVAPFADMKALPTDAMSVVGVTTKAYRGGAKFQNGDVLLARITPCLENGKTALVDFLCGQEVGFGSTEFIVLRPTQRICCEYVYCLARDEAFRNHCIAGMVGSSGRQRVQTACLDTFFVALPNSGDFMKLFQECVTSSFNKITANVRTMNNLASLRDTLLPKLLSGELDITSVAKSLEGLL